MIARLASLGAIAALLAAPSLTCAQGIAAYNFETPGANSNSNPALGAMAADSFNPEFGPRAQDAPADQSALSVRVYNAKMEYARGFTDLQLGKFQEAESEFRNALSVHPDDMKSLYMLGVARSGEGDLKGALQAFERALKIAPMQISVRREYAVTLAKLGQTDKAQAQLGLLKLRADACGGSCAEADDFKAALVRVQAALSGGLGAAG